MQSISIKNFRSLDDVNLKLASGVTLVLGANGAGKSSLAGALQFALAGHCQWTDKAGKGFASLIKHGASQALIDITTPHNAIMRTLTMKNTSLAVDTKAGKDALALLTSILPDPDLLLAMLRSDGFVDLPAKSQQDILFKLSGGSANADWFKAQLNDAEREILHDELTSLLTGAELADSLYKAAYTRRTEANKNYKELKASIEADEGNSPVAVDIKALEQQATDLQERIEQKAEIVGQVKAKAEEKERLERDYEAARQEFNRRSKDLTLYNLPEKNFTPADITGLEDHLKNQQRVLSAMEHNFKVANDDFIRAKAEVDAIDKMPAGHCVLSETITCPIDENQRIQIRSARMQALQEADKALTEAKEAHSQQEQTVQTAAEAFNQAKALQGQYEACEKDKAEVARLKAKCDDLQRRIETTAGLQLTSLQSELAKLKEEQVKLNGELRRAQEANAQAETLAKRKANIGYLKDRADLLDDLVKKLSPDGLPAQAMGNTVGTVVNAINEVLTAISDFTLAIPAGDFELQIHRTEDSLPTPVNHLSESEKLRVGAAIQVAFAKLTGFNFVMVDAADRLDTPNRTALLKMLITSNIQALVLATPLNGKRPQAPGLAVYDIVDGTLQAVQTEAVAA